MSALRRTCGLMLCLTALLARGYPQSATFEAAASAATVAREAGKPADAAREYQRALQLRPDWPEGWWYLGSLQYDASRFEEAENSFEKLVALAPTLGAAWNFLGLCEYETRSFEKAREALEKGLSLGGSEDPETARVAAYHLVLLRIRSKEFDAAATLLRNSFANAAPSDPLKAAWGLTLLRVPLLPEEVSPDRDALIHQVGAAALARESQQPSQAKDILTKLAAEYPNAPNLRSLIKGEHTSSVANEDALVAYFKSTTLTASNQQDLQAAMRAYEAGRFADATERLKAWLASHPDDGTAWAVLGLSEFALKDFSNARLHLQRGQQLGFGGSDTSVRLANYTLGSLLLQNGDFESAGNTLYQHYNEANASEELKVALGMALLRIQGMPSEFTGSLRQIAKDAGGIYVLLRASEYDKAFTAFDALIARAPRQPFVHYAYGTALVAISRFEEAATQFRQEILLSPQSELPYLRLASLELRQKKVQEAMAPATKAVQLAPSSGEAHYLLGRARLESGDTGGAISELEAARKLSPNSPEIPFALARAYMRANDPAKAEEQRAAFAELNKLAEQQKNRSGSHTYETTHGGALPQLQATQPN